MATRMPIPTSRTAKITPTVTITVIAVKPCRSWSATVFTTSPTACLIAAAFLADPVLGWAATLAIIAHEVPQEAGDFAILLAAGWQRGRALFWNGVSSLTALAGGIIGYFALERALDWVPHILTIAAASFLYIAVADLMPRLKREQQSIGWHGLLLAAGIAVVVFGSSHSH